MAHWTDNVPVPVDEDGMPNFLTEADLWDGEKAHAMCAHVNSEQWQEDTGDSETVVRRYMVFVCHDCGLEMSRDL